MFSGVHRSGSVRPSKHGRHGRFLQQRFLRLQFECLEARLLLAGIDAFHQSGQTFITWQEDTGRVGEVYQVYRHTAPITAANLSAATLLTERWGPLAEGSSAYLNERNWPDPWHPAPIQRNFIIHDGGPELSDTTGLFVWTTPEAGTFYYAVTTVYGGVEDRNVVAGSTATVTGLVETVAEPAPVRVHTTASGRGIVYTQFMDYAAWNPTFEGYAYNYSVALPADYDGSVAVPLLVYMEGWGGRYQVRDGAPEGDWNSIWLYVDDPHQTWHYGFHGDFDYRTFDPRDPNPPTTGTIVNFTEQRILRAVDEVSRLYRVDPNRIHGHGSSMGGSGMITMCMRYPNVFSAIYAGLPMTNYAAADGRGGTTDWRSDLEPKWGTIAANLPIENRGRHAAHLVKYNGLGVWDWMDDQTQAVDRAGDETAYLCYVHTMQDGVIAWETQGQPFPGALSAGHIGFQGAAIPGNHSWPGFEGSNEVMIGGDASGGWAQFQFRRDLSFPAFSNASHASAIPPPTSTTQRYYYNQDLEWSVPWHAFGEQITDELTEYGMTLRSTSGNQTADVTPRRLQRFAVLPGTSYQWTNTDTTTAAVLQTGTAMPDAHGLLTIPGVQILARGNRLRITAGPSTYLYVSPSGSDAHPGTLAEPLGTVQQALELAEPGMTVLLRGGIYHEFISFPRSGTDGAPITLTGYPSETAVLDGTGLEWRYAIDLGTHDDLRIENLTIRNYIREGLRGYAIGGSGGNDAIVLRGLDISGVGEVIKLQAAEAAVSHQVLIENVTAHDYDFGGIDVGPEGSIDGLTIRNVTLAGPVGGDNTAVDGIAVEDGQNITLDNVRVTGHPGDGVDLKADHVVLRRVAVTGTARDGIKLWGTDVLIENSLAMNTGQTALVVATQAQVTARNNLFGNGGLGGYGYSIAIGEEAGASGSTFASENNLFVCDNGNSGALLLLGEGTVFSGDRNLYYAPDRPDTVIPFPGHGEFSAAALTDGTWSGSVGADAHARYGDPLFVDPSHNDFHLRPGSPAIDHGVSGPSVDLDNRARPFGSGYDLGPYEWRGGSVVLGFPNTAEGIHVFSDQFPDDLSATMLNFIASHYDGSQKMQTVFTDAVRAHNPDFVMLHYRLAVGQGQHSLLINDQWVSDWADVNPHEDWFLHAQSNPSQRLRQTAWDWNLMDIANSQWREYWLNSTIDQLRAVEAQGVFADSWDVGAYNSDVLAPADARFAGTSPRDNGWTTTLGNLTQYLVTGLSATPEDFLYLPNLGTLVTSWDNTDYALADGGMVEGFGEWGAGLNGESSDWQLQLDRVLDLAGQDKVLLLQGTLRDEPNTPAGLQHRLFVLGSYLLAKDDYTYINVLPPAGDLGVYYYPEYEVDLGRATTALPTQVDDLLWNGVYRRNFANGFVLVNPTDTAQSIPLGGTYEVLVPSGGGGMSDADITADGSYRGGNVSWQELSTAVLPVASAAILRPAAHATTSQDVFFLHQSTGQGIMEDHGSHPGLVSQIEARGYTFGDYSLWDSPPGNSLPTDIATLFADTNGDGHFGDAFDSVVALHGAAAADILMLKSCFLALSHLEDSTELAQWEQAFIDNVAPYANQHPAQKLVVMPAVPLRAEAGLSAAAAARARDWGEWLAGAFIRDYTTRGNVYAFDLFNFWADAETQPTNANRLKQVYCRSDDDHPNDAAYSAAADALTVFLTGLTPAVSWQNPANAVDVNGDGLVTPLDVLIVINYINLQTGSTSLPSPPTAPPPYYDVSGDGQCTSLDVLSVIAYINNRVSGASGEAAGIGSELPTVTLASAAVPARARWSSSSPRLQGLVLAELKPLLSEIADELSAARRI